MFRSAGARRPWLECVFAHLQIYDRRERRLIGLADAGLRLVAPLVRRRRPRRSPVPPGRILLLRLERIGDLIMTLGAIREVRLACPDAQIDLVVGSWNHPLATLIDEVDQVETLDAPWLARGAEGAGSRDLLRAARHWRARRYDVAINFEADIRSNLLAAASAAPIVAGFASAGGGPLLDVALTPGEREHTASRTIRLVRTVFARPPSMEGAGAPTCPSPRLHLRERTDLPAALAGTSSTRGGPAWTIGVHAGAGRQVKQWPPDRFASTVNTLADNYTIRVVLTGNEADRKLADRIKERFQPGIPVIDLVGLQNLLELASVLEHVDVMISCDTGPMHLASAVGTPVVGVFGPSDPCRYAPLGDLTRIVRVDLPCSPCNRIRLPPVRCRGIVPDCLRGVEVGAVVAAVDGLLTMLAEHGDADRREG